MVPPVVTVSASHRARRVVADALAWDVSTLRHPLAATAFLREVGSLLPFFVSRTGLLLVSWTAHADGDDRLAIQPRLDPHCEPWLRLPAAAVRPTGARIEADHSGAERVLWLQMPERPGRAGARVPLSTGLMRMSMQAHDEHVRFLPVLVRDALREDRFGGVSLQLHTLDAAALARLGMDAALRRNLVTHIAGQVMALMALPGAGLARDVPMIVDPADK